MVCQKTEVCLWRTAMKVLPYSVGFFMVLPYLKKDSTYRFTSSTYNGVHAQSSTLLRLEILCMSWTLTTVHQKPWKGVQRRGQLSRVNGTIKMQQALNIQINAKSHPFPKLLFFLQNCGHRKAATDPRTQVQQLLSNKKWFHFSPRVCDFQPPCRSHAHRTTRFLGKFIQSTGGTGR